MARRYDSFVVRIWHVSDGIRIDVEHLQSGERTRAETLATAFTWINIQCGELADPDAAVGYVDRHSKEVIPSNHRATDQRSID